MIVAAREVKAMTKDRQVAAHCKHTKATHAKASCMDIVELELTFGGISYDIRDTLLFHDTTIIGNP